MGSRTAADLADCVSEGILSLENAVQAHLSHNCYPPVPNGYLGPCVEAIKLAGKDEWDERIETAVGHYDTVADLVRICHLEAFVTLAEPDEYELGG